MVLTSSFPRFPGDSSGVFLYHLCKELQTLGVDISVVAPHDYGCEKHEVWEEIEIHRFPYFYPLRFQKLCYGAGILKNVQERPLVISQLPLFILLEAYHACRILQKKKFDLVHAHWSIPQGFIALLMNKLLGIPWVTSLHGSDVYGLKAALIRDLNSRVIRRTNACTANSRATAKVAWELSGREDIQIIPMGVNIDFFNRDGKRAGPESPFENKEQIILFAGRLIEWKGVGFLIKAFALVLKEEINARLVIVGSGPDKGRLVNLVEKLHLQEKVVFHDAVSQVELVRYYSMADAFVLPSIVSDSGETEGLGVVLLEAMASGLPVIGTRVGGIPDIIKDGETGLLAHQRDPHDLAEKILMLLKDRGLTQRLAENGSGFVRNEFSWNVVAGKFKNVYENVLLRESLPF